MSIDPKEVDAARLRLGPQVIGINDNIFGILVRALLATHPEPEKVRHKFDMLFGQLLATPPYIGNQDARLVAHDLVETAFRPPKTLDL